MTTLTIKTYLTNREVLLLNVVRTARKPLDLAVVRHSDGHLRLQDVHTHRNVFYIIDETLFDAERDWPLAMLGTSYKNHIVTPLGDELGLDFRKAYA